MASAVSICNLALARVGVQQTISSLTERGSHAQSCNAFYDLSRQAMLREVPWSFAERYATLTLIEQNGLNGWGFTYAYPQEAVRVNHIVSTSGVRNPNPPTPFKIMSIASGRTIATDVQNAVCSYNADIIDVNFFDPLFLDALAWKIAAELAPAITTDNRIMQTVQNNYYIAFRKAAAVAMNEEGQEESPCRLLDSRK